ncbi:radical SAM protein [Flavobacterium luteum]|uniref:Radical SAM protein n=1 Tax=Flavobacterium luteum TaxID=2026654 RepID=A0A7J5AEA2_9FLAO|nr:radical SAM protein [Flavobacterium luteum]KAB1155823.1 radical SAM protein [Flavobacterium luteum]
MKKFAKRVFKAVIVRSPFKEKYLKHQNTKYLDHIKAKELNKYNAKEPIISVVNLNANDICNSKCVMCNIWEQKQGFEITPDQLKNILQDPLFKNVKHMGVTGGEPTLREDLPQLYESIIKTLPDIIGLSIITNCIKEKDVIDRIEKVSEICSKHDKAFSMMVSLDGYGKMHDQIRGREGNFESAINVIKHFTQKGIPVSTGSTISKQNVWEMDDLLDFMKANNIYGRFRVAEFIKRLYNDNKAEAIRNFDEDERYNLILFFYKLIFTFETHEAYIRTYKSIINILDGGKRTTGCPYHSDGVVLNSRGEIAYCAPKSEIIGSTLKASALDLYKDNQSEKTRIKENECDSCIHDYHAPISYKELESKFEEDFWKKYIHVQNTNLKSVHKKIAPKKEYKKQAFITGWYGTETVGDKAILAGIINELKESNEEIGFVITSLYPPITKRTVYELGFENVTVIPVYCKEFVEYAKGSDMIIMGGGPLMDLGELALPLISFKIGKYYKKKNIVYGCGIGPLYNPIYEQAVKDILDLSDEIMIRDEKSRQTALKWTNNAKEVKLSGDPAKKYIKSIASQTNVSTKSTILKCFLREWTHEYCKELTHEEFIQKRKLVEFSLSKFVKQKAIELGATEIYLEHMHNFVIGNDDRDFSRHFIKTYFEDFEIPISYNKKLSTVNSIVDSMLNSCHNICMRFHSVVFADTLNTSYTAFDYTGGGKILGYLTDNSKKENLLTISDLLEKNK